MPVKQRNRISYIAGRNVKLLQPPWEMVWQFLKESNMHLTYDPMIVLGYSEILWNVMKSYVHTVTQCHIQTWMFKWNFTPNPKLEMTQMSFKGCLVKYSMLHPPTENYTAMKRNQLLIDSRKLRWVGKKNPKKVTYSSIPYFQNDKTIGMENSDCWGLGVEDGGYKARGSSKRRFCDQTKQVTKLQLNSAHTDAHPNAHR